MIEFLRTTLSTTKLTYKVGTVRTPPTSTSTMTACKPSPRTSSPPPTRRVPCLPRSSRDVRMASPKSAADYAGTWTEKKKDGAKGGQTLEITQMGPCLVSATTPNTPHIRLSQLSRCLCRRAHAICGTVRGS
jgi:hypothetical protein